MTIYKGHKINGGSGAQVVLRNGRPLSPRASQRLRCHSPDGFNWGYQGSGPAQLALALLYNVTQDKVMALRYYQDFKRDRVSLWRDSWTVTDSDIRAWLFRQEGVNDGTRKAKTLA